MTRVLYPGSFDPIHNGHLEIIETASRLFDEVVVAAMRNPQKGEPLFPLDERQAMLEESVAHLDNARVTMFSNLVVDLAREMEADFIVKGLRTGADFEIEQQMAQTNHAVTGIRTVYVPCRPALGFVSSRFVREIAQYGGDVSRLVPTQVAEALRRTFAGDRQDGASR